MKTPSASQTTTLDQRAVADVAIHQWTLGDGTRMGVRIQALSFKDVMLAEKAATDKDGKVNPWRLAAEEIARGVYDPPGLTVDHVLAWNAEVVEYVQARIRKIGGYAAAPLAADLARNAAGLPPAPPAPPGAGHDGDPNLGNDAGEEAGDSAA